MSQRASIHIPRGNVTTAPEVILKCAEDGDAAVGTCALCRDPVCVTCVSRRDGIEIACRRCDYQDALKGTVRGLAERKAGNEKARSEREPGRAGRIRGMAAAAVLAVCVPVFALFQLPALIDALKDPPPFAYGAGDTADAPGLEQAIAGLWEVERAMDEFLARHGGIAPNSIAELKGAPAACPGCGAAWKFERDASGWEIGCPKPRSHARSGVFIDSHYGPPQVTRGGNAGGN